MNKDIKSGLAFHVLPSRSGSKNVGRPGKHAYITHFELFGLSYEYQIAKDNRSEDDSRPQHVDLKNTECALWLCVQAYNTSITGNIQHDEIVGVIDTISNPEPGEEFDYFAVPEELDHDGSTNFAVDYTSIARLQDFFFDGLLGNGSISNLSHTYSSDLVHGAWNGSTNATAWINNLATSMTNAMRVANHISRKQYHGTRYELAVVVRWYWLVLPAALVLASLVYLFFVVHRTAASHVHSWKGSPLTLLLFELDPKITGIAHDHVDRPGGLLKSIGNVKVRIEGVGGGVRKLHAC